MIVRADHVVVPKFFPVPQEDVDLLTSAVSVHGSLLDFWARNGAGDFNRGRDGNKLNELVANRLLDADDILDLVCNASLDIADMLEVGIPFFNKLDREFIAITQDGEIVDVAGSGGRRLVAKSLGEFIQRLLVTPFFYEDHLSGDDLKSDDVFGRSSRGLISRPSFLTGGLYGCPILWGQRSTPRLSPPSRRRSGWYSG